MRRRAYAALTTVCAITTALCAGITPAAAVTPPSIPRPDHVVVVVEENHSGTEVVGNANAPYISSLAASNASLDDAVVSR